MSTPKHTRRAHLLLRLVLLPLVARVAAHGESGWEVLAQCSSWVSLNTQYQVLGGGASVEVDVPVDSFAAHFNVNGAETVSGQTRVNVSGPVLFKGAPLSNAAVLVAHLHAGRCSATPPGGPHYLQNVKGADDALQPPAAATGQGANTFSVRVRNGVSSSAVQPFLVDYDRALSVVLHEGAATSGYEPSAVGSRAACCDLVPNLPDLPETWSATIELNFGLDKSYTAVRQEFYSSTLNKMAVVQHSNLARTVQVTDMNLNVTYRLSQNSSYPNGICEAQPIGGGPGQQMVSSNGQLRSTAAFLQFDPTQPISFDGVNIKNVRAISCERWTRNFTFPFGGGVTSSGVASYYFPISTWANRGESFHRLLKRVEINGTRLYANGTGLPFYHSYEFVNFVPAITNSDVFNPCYVLQAGGLGVPRTATITGCGCERYGRPAAAPAPASKGAACSAGSLAALGILLPLFTLAVGACGGLALGRKNAAVAPKGHEPLLGEVALTPAR